MIQKHDAVAAIKFIVFNGKIPWSETIGKFGFEAMSSYHHHLWSNHCSLGTRIQQYLASQDQQEPTG